MSNTFKLADIQAKANETYGHFTVEIGQDDVVVLRNILQLSEEEREQFTEEDDEKVSTLDRLRKQVRITAEDKDAAERLIEALGDNLAYFIQLIKEYNEATQAGEA